MNCPNCSADNRPGATFCGSCGRPLRVDLLPVCDACNAALRVGARFCHRCGRTLSAIVGAELATPVEVSSSVAGPEPVEPQSAAISPSVVAAEAVCANCGQTNRATASFCHACRAPLLVTCDLCGQQNRAAALFCRECGAPLVGAALPAVDRPPTNGLLPITTRPPPRSTPIVCEFCGRAIHGGARFCPHCGQSPTSRHLAVAGKFTTGQMPQGYLLRGSDGAEYMILRLIAQGGMGAVYEIGRMSDGTHWAMKEMSETAFARGDRAKTVAQFREEADLLRALRHDNLPRVADVFETNHRHFLVMELIEGQTLNQLLDAHGGPLPERDVVDWGAQLCRVLAFLHSRNPPIIYRDLKPDNIMVETAGGRVKLIDFGIARRFKGGKRSDTFMLGTRGYAAPEQFGKAESDARTDLYALGATLHHLLTHENPTSRKLFDFPPLASYAHLKLSRRTCEAIDVALQPTPDARPPDAAALYKALTGRTMPPPPPATAPPPAAADGQRRAPALTGRLEPSVPLDLGTAQRGEQPSGSLPVVGASGALVVEPRSSWLAATPERVVAGSDRVTVTAHTGGLALGREDKPVNYQPRFVVDVLWWLILWLYGGHARLIVPAPRRHEGAVRVGQQEIAVAVTVTPTPGELSTGRLVSAAAVALEVTVAVLALVYAVLLL
ncbi:MAG: protein kinase [Candidatus Promineofilum sp.]|nr:protein kinase [Promineifilum sp.]